MRIAFIAGTYAPDRCGVADYTKNLREYLVQQYVESVVLTTAQADLSDPTVWGVVKDWRLGSLPKLIQAVHYSQADILHIQHAAGTYGFERSLFLFPLLLRLSGWKKPIVTTIHEYGWWEWQPKWLNKDFLEWLKEYGQQRNWWDREDGFLLTQSNAIITTNLEAETLIRSRLPHLQPQRIPIGVNITVTSVPKTEARHVVLQKFQWTEAAQIFAFFGFLHPVKGLETLLAAFRIAHSKQPNLRLLLIGGVESLALQAEAAKQYWQKLEHQIESLNLQNAVQMTGYVDSETASTYLQGADVGVLPFNPGVTLKSGSLLAMLAHQLPVVATESNDLELQQARIVKTVKSRDVEQLAAALLEPPSESGYELSQQFSWSNIAIAHQTLYASCLK
jgi:polysaccharide biosynthesis protein PslF